MNTIEQLGRIAAREMVKAAQQPESVHKPRRPPFTAQFPGHLNDSGDPSSYSHVPANPTNAPAMASNMPAKPWHQPWAPEPVSFNQPPAGDDPFAALPEVGTPSPISLPAPNFPPAPSLYEQAGRMMGPDPFKPLPTNP
jgi:hypothetical protein